MANLKTMEISTPRHTERSPLLASLRRSISMKTIGLFGSIVLIELPKVFDSAGVIPTCLVIILTSIISSFCATLLADTMSSIPGNDKFDRNIEFSSSFMIFLNRKWYLASEIIFFCSLMSQNIAAMVATAQALDSFIAQFLFGRTWALQLQPTVTIVQWVRGECGSLQEGLCVPFNDDGSLVITMGYLLATMLLLPFGLMHLKDNMLVQKLSFGLLFLLCAEFFWAFAMKKMSSDHLVWFGNNYSDLIGVVLFNFAFPITIPCWLYEKRADVSVNKAVWFASAPSALLFLAFGVAGASAFPKVTDNILVVLGSQHVDPLTNICSCLFAVVIIGFGIPIFCVLMRENLLSGGLCPRPLAVFMGGIFPYLVGWLFYQGHAALVFISWAGLLFTGFVAFIGPLIVCYLASKCMDESRNMSSSLSQGGVRYHSVLTQTPSVRLIRGSVEPLPAILEPWRRVIIGVLLLLCSLMVAFAVVVNFITMETGEDL